MTCDNMERCGGCTCRGMDEKVYRERKFAAFRAIVDNISVPTVNYARPVFVGDQTRRRAALAFEYKKKQLTLGFNQARSSQIIDLCACPLLTPRLNSNFFNLRRLLEEVCAYPFQVKKGRKVVSVSISKGDVWICDAENGIDVVLEFPGKLELNHRMTIFELVNTMPDIIRVSHRTAPDSQLEPIVEKARPYVKIGAYDVFIPAGTFLQPSAEGEQTLTGLVRKYLAGTRGKIADLFCGVGTFSYVLAADTAKKITAVDSSPGLLKAFQESVNRNVIPNICILARNLFKYPLQDEELSTFDAVIFDPPRAGASTQSAALAALPAGQRPPKVVAVSCNPRTFVNDADKLIAAGYKLEEVTMVDQFIYSDHSELVALFTTG